MKKLLLIVIAVVGAVVAKKKLDEGKVGEAQWHQATDPVRPASS